MSHKDRKRRSSDTVKKMLPGSERTRDEGKTGGGKETDVNEDGEREKSSNVELIGDTEGTCASGVTEITVRHITKSVSAASCCQRRQMRWNRAGFRCWMWQHKPVTAVRWGV